MCAHEGAEPMDEQQVECVVNGNRRNGKYPLNCGDVIGSLKSDFKDAARLHLEQVVRSILSCLLAKVGRRRPAPSAEHHHRSPACAVRVGDRST